MDSHTHKKKLNEIVDRIEFYCNIIIYVDNLRKTIIRSNFPAKVVHFSPYVYPSTRTNCKYMYVLTWIYVWNRRAQRLIEFCSLCHVWAMENFNPFFKLKKHKNKTVKTIFVPVYYAADIYNKKKQ